VSDHGARPPTIPEIEELLGAYALDALDPDERALVDEHLVSCPRCRAELADHLEVAALLGNTAAPAPDGLWARIAESLEEPPPVLRLSVQPAKRPRPTRLLIAAVAAAVLLIAGLGAEIVHQERRIDDMAASISAQGVQADMVRAMADPDSHKMALTPPDGGPMSAAAVMTSSGSGYFMATSMPALSEDRTYQLWGVMADGQVVSLGVLGHDPHLAAFQASGGLTGLAVTEEVQGGVASSTNPVVLKA